MKTKDVWVIFNKKTLEILFVYPEEFLAKNKLEWYWNEDTGPVSGTGSNREKIEAITLYDALEQIHRDYCYTYASMCD